jgi:hypothetical protein
LAGNRAREKKPACVFKKFASLACLLTHVTCP